jgi:hypothetical protein
MKRNSTILALVIGLTLFGLACSKSDTAVANMSDEDKHRLFQAVGVTRDTALIMEASKKMGLVDSNGQPTPDFQKFTSTHMEWAMKNVDFVREYMTEPKAREYVKSHMP